MTPDRLAQADIFCRGLNGCAVEELAPIDEACFWDHFDSAYPDPGASPLAPTDSCYFASGSNHPGEITGLADAGFNVGVAVQSLVRPPEALFALRRLVGRATKVFVDSGAFSEVGAYPFPIVNEITDAEWNRRLAIYDSLAALGAQLYVVAPDCVGHQDVTLARLERYAGRMRSLADRGVNIIVPVQRGATSMVDFWQQELALLADIPAGRLVPGIPSAKDACPVDQLAAFLAAARPARVHLLGLGPRARAGAYAERLAVAASAGAEVLCDAVLICALVGRSNGKGGGPRLLTAARDAVLATGLFDKKKDTTYVKRAMCRALIPGADLLG